MTLLSVALTGNVASGKSTVAAQWARAGVPVVSADELARIAVAPGSTGLREVVEAFGDTVLAADGTLDRGRLRDVVFGDSDARERLESILHPRIWGLRAEWMEARRAEAVPLVVAEIPLLFETGREGDFDLTVLVDAPEGERLRRLVEVRGLAEADARAVMASQMDPARKRALAGKVLDNAGTPEDLEHAAAAMLAVVREMAGVPELRMDLHLHTAGSWDCLSNPDDVLDRLTGLGFGRFAITDHNRLGVALRMAEAYPDRIVAGEEVKTAEGIDVIGLYLSDEIPKGTGARETIQRIREQGGIAYLPHPYAGGKGGGGRLADALGPLCDVIEVFNGRLHSETPNLQAAALAKRHSKLSGAGSDAHTIGELGNAFVVLPDHPNHAAGLLEALRHARTGGRAAPRWVHLASTWAKVRKKLPG